MDDLISRQAAIDALFGWMADKTINCDAVDVILRVPSAQLPDMNVGDMISRTEAIRIASGYCHPANIADELRKLPSAQPKQQWTPCSDGLPEEKMWTICQNDAGAMMIGKYDIEFGWMFPAYFDGIVAWMPLPEPYAERRTDE